jgi:hypothetical protein
LRPSFFPTRRPRAEDNTNDHDEHIRRQALVVQEGAGAVRAVCGCVRATERPCPNGSRTSAIASLPTATHASCPLPPQPPRLVRHREDDGEAGAGVRAGRHLRRRVRAGVRETDWAVPYAVGDAAGHGVQAGGGVGRLRARACRAVPCCARRTAGGAREGRQQHATFLRPSLATHPWVQPRPFPCLRPSPIKPRPAPPHTHVLAHRSRMSSNSWRTTTCSAQWPPSA